MEACALTDTGQKRSMNQDFIYASTDPVGSLENLFIVADGMGGHQAGDIQFRTDMLHPLTSASSYGNHAFLAVIGSLAYPHTVGSVLQALDVGNRGLKIEIHLLL